MRVLHIGLTGGVGSGKSTVAGMLQALGAHTIDADALSRAVTSPGGAAIEPIRAAFGPKAIAADGGMDRAHMRSVVFADAAAKKQLETIVHPLVRAATERAVEQALASGTARCIVYDVPLLVESAVWRQRVAEVWVVDCAEATQISRVMARSGLDEAAVRAVMAAQATRAQRLAAADAVIHNDGLDLAQLQQCVQQLAEQRWRHTHSVSSRP
jgi:dephospho-CoA kinase